MSKLKQFGLGDSSIDWGYDLELLVGHYESLVNTEQNNIGLHPTKQMTSRLELAEDCLDKLYKILAFEG